RAIPHASGYRWRIHSLLLRVQGDEREKQTYRNSPTVSNRSGDILRLVAYGYAFDRANRGEEPQVAPAVTAVKGARCVEQSFRPQHFINGARGIVRLGEQHHRRDALTEKSVSDMTEQATPQALALVFPPQVNLAEFAGKIGKIRVTIRHPFGKPYQF